MSAGPPESAQPTLADRVDSHFEFCALHGKDLVDYGKRKRVGDGNIAEAALAAGDNVVGGSAAHRGIGAARGPIRRAGEAGDPRSAR